jgi:hypothetical protein
MADGLMARVLAILVALPPFLAFMAAVYLALHVVFGRVIRSPDSPVLWFFSVVTGPLLRPVRACLPAGTSEERVRAVALGAYAGAWLGLRALLGLLGIRA